MERGVKTLGLCAMAPDKVPGATMVLEAQGWRGEVGALDHCPIPGALLLE